MVSIPIRSAPRGIYKRSGGNKTLHSIQWTETSFHLKVRELMCYCEFCSYENCDDDLNKDYVSNWEERAIEGKPTRAVVAQQQESRPCL